MTATSTEIEPLLASAQEQLRSNKPVKLSDLLDTLVQAERPALPAKIPLPVQITKSQREAIDLLPAVFGKVVPTERRKLVPAEVDALLEEYDVLKTIEKMVAERKTDGIRLTVLNHNDVAFEEQASDEADVERDKDGHYLRKAQVQGSPEATQAFSVEPRAGAASVSLSKLEEMVADPDVDFDQKDFLAMTTQVRVFDEHKAFLVLKKKPELLAVLRDATTKGQSSVAVQPRARKI